MILDRYSHPADPLKPSGSRIGYVMLLILGLLGLALTGCLPSRALGLPANVSLRVGQKVNFNNGSSLKVLTIEDSRCPLNTRCISAGNVKVLVELSGKDGQILQTSLNSDPRYKQSLNFENLRLELKDVLPYPGSPEALKGDKAQAQFLADKEELN
ncbi:MAG: hypothetical protein R2880_08475 [Deinococcales bacterium]